MQESTFEIPHDLFAQHTQTRFVLGAGCLDELGQHVQSLGCSRALVFSDPGIVAAGHTSRGGDSLAAANIEFAIFDQIAENPTTQHVAAGVAIAKHFRPDLMIGLGGGSSMDCAKGVNFIYTNGGSIADYWGVGKATRPMLPMIAVPTTAGTGSESQSFALISDAQTKRKMACGDKRAAFRIALLDPKLTLTQPPQVAAITGVDAIAHAVESAVCTRSNPKSLACSLDAWQRLAASFPTVMANPQDLAARHQMQLGACLGGIAIENSMLGAAHALANPLTANYGIVHGCAVGVMLPHVVRFNTQCSSKTYAQLANLAGLADVAELPELLEQLLATAGIDTTLVSYGVAADRLPELAEDAAQQWTAQFNPRPARMLDLLHLYEQAFA